MPTNIANPGTVFGPAMQDANVTLVLGVARDFAKHAVLVFTHLLAHRGHNLDVLVEFGRVDEHLNRHQYPVFAFRFDELRNWDEIASLLNMTGCRGHVDGSV